ncbi:MAG: 3-hydroxyisobutyrate dehydrogenase [Legionellales bacterium RIFCSPHIGHO2_12_FULL_42_9]|nr:MAG: 3-hydroxyisobutyrate dehydrogenase [Legionellales bacterium RIFCSPHIGHO2_12_FULL_42_9]
MTRIGFIGLGNMGLPMATNLIKASYEVTGFDLNPEVLAKFQATGGHKANSVSETALNKTVIITMLQTGEQVKRVCLGAQGFYHLVPNALHIDCSSIDVESTQQLHQEATAHKLVMIDAPVSGGVRGAEAATLTLMVGGEKEALELAMPYLTTIGKKIIHAGGAGAGQAAKICNNMILGISMVAISEAFVLAAKLGLSAEKLFEVVTNSSGQCWAMTNYAPVPDLVPAAPASHNYQPGFSAAMMLKDLKLSQDSANAVSVQTPIGQQVTQLYQRFVQAGDGGLDFSAIIKSLAAD